MVIREIRSLQSPAGQFPLISNVMNREAGIRLHSATRLQVRSSHVVLHKCVVRALVMSFHRLLFLSYWILLEKASAMEGCCWVAGETFLSPPVLAGVWAERSLWLSAYSSTCFDFRWENKLLVFLLLAVTVTPHILQITFFCSTSDFFKPNYVKITDVAPFFFHQLLLLHCLCACSHFHSEAGAFHSHPILQLRFAALNCILVFTNWTILRLVSAFIAAVSSRAELT